jgi:hypothetical protein
MNVRQLFLGAFAICLATTTAFCQTGPLNDNFTNRTILSGSSITFTGSLVNATSENGELFQPPASNSGSIWWSWTATSSTPVIIALSRDTNSPDSMNTWFEVFTGQAMASLSRIDYNAFDFLTARYVKFAATSGTTYQFRAAGGWQGTLTLQLIASASPVITQQPLSRTNSPYSSTIFSVTAAGIPSPGYQWLFNGVPLAGETAPILIVYNTLTNLAGSYAVVVSNAGGASQSVPATLSIIETNPVPVLEALPLVNPLQFAFSLRGQPGRWYKFDVKVDDQQWTNRLWFGLCTNESSIFSVPSFSGKKLLARAALAGDTDACVAQLSALEAARGLCAIEKKAGMNSGFAFYELLPYLKGQHYLYCPLGGSYSISGGLTNPIHCSLEQLAGHQVGD